MTVNNYSRGRRAEIFAACALLLKGYWPLAFRLRTPLGEIDLLVARGSTLVLVEVKYRPTLEAARAAIAQRQQERIVRAVDYVRAQARYARYKNIRCDVVLVVPGQWPEHIENAFCL